MYQISPAVVLRVFPRERSKPTKPTICRLHGHWTWGSVIFDGLAPIGFGASPMTWLSPIVRQQTSVSFHRGKWYGPEQWLCIAKVGGTNLILDMGTKTVNFEKTNTAQCLTAR